MCCQKNPVVLLGLEVDKFTILEVKKLPEENWFGIGTELTLQGKQDHIDQLTYLIDLLDDTHLSVFVEGRNTRFQKCVSVKHLEVFCPQTMKNKVSPLPTLQIPQMQNHKQVRKEWLCSK